jgi:thioredoxin reductase (NADPH)
MTQKPPPGWFDALVIGGGPAGLSAAIYLGRARRSVAVFDRGRPGRSDWAQYNQNYLGFPEGISIVELCSRGREQAARFGAELFEADITDLRRTDGGFAAAVADGEVCGRAVVLATGVTDRWVSFPGYTNYIGRSMHTCIVCDGYEMAGQRVVIAGNDEHAAEVARQTQEYDAATVTLVTNSDQRGIPDEIVEALAARNIRVIVDRIVSAHAREKGMFAVVQLARGGDVELDHLFSVQGADPNAALALALGVETASNGYIQTDIEQRTNVPGVYAAGDVTRFFSHLVLSAAHEGATAATSLSYDLYQRERETFADQGAGTP